MEKDFKGMNTELADKAKDLIKEKKEELVKESKEASKSLKQAVNNVFKDNKDRENMFKYIDEINDSLEILYGYLDGNKKCFTKKLNDFIQSYIISDKNVKEYYSDLLKNDKNKNKSVN